MTSEKDKYKLPDWTGCPPKGTHLDVVKGPKLIQLLIDEKGHYYFGRNPTDCDFVCEHASCSRVHAVLLFHKLLRRFAIVDLESSHGTFVENVRIDSLAPVFLNADQCFHFGASTRRYFLREKLFTGRDENDEEVEIESGFSQAQSDLDSSTESNTAQNRRIPPIPQTLDDARRKMRLRPKVQFTEEEEIINPEDVDPSVGRFRNMIRTAVIPTAGEKRHQRDDEDQLFDFYSPTSQAKKLKISPAKATTQSDRMSSFASSSLGTLSLNAAPDLELYTPALPQPKAAGTAKYGPAAPMATTNASGPRQKLSGIGTVSGGPEPEECPSKKKYAKEAWPRDVRRSNSGVF